MNVSSYCLKRQRCRHWLPLISQQSRIRHIIQIYGMNFSSDKQINFYFTLHLTSLSAPFFTSEKVSGPNPKWTEFKNEIFSNLPNSLLVIRIWQYNNNSGEDCLLNTWGVNISGLFYIGNKISDLKPIFFNDNTLIFVMHYGYFTYFPFINKINDKENLLDNFKCTKVKIIHNDIGKSYNLDQLRRIQFLQISIKKKSEQVQILREQINIQNDYSKTENNSNNNSNSSNSNNKYASKLLTMNYLNKMLEEKPTKLQKQQMIIIQQNIEWLHFINKLLIQQKESQFIHNKQQKCKLCDLSDKNEEKSTEIMENYHMLQKEIEKIKYLKKNIIYLKHECINTFHQLQQRQKQLIQELLFIYPIEELSPKKYFINNVYLPDSDILADCTDIGLSVALGYIAHVLIMCSKILQVPLKYPVIHCGSRSYTTDHISSILSDKDRDFPLYTKGKEKMQFNYAVYLLNKNISQLRWNYFINTQELKSTLYNLLTFLNTSELIMTPSIKLNDNEINNTIVSNENFKFHNNFDSNNKIDPILDTIRKEPPLKKNEIITVNDNKQIKLNQQSNNNDNSLGKILEISEAFLNKQITTESFKNYYYCEKKKFKDCDDKTLDVKIELNENNSNLKKDKSTSSCCNINSKFSNNCDDTNIAANDNCENENQIEFLENIISNHKSSNELYLQNKQSTSSSLHLSNIDNALMIRTNALLTNKTFNLVKPKH